MIEILIKLRPRDGKYLRETGWKLDMQDRWDERKRSSRNGMKNGKMPRHDSHLKPLVKMSCIQRS